MNDKPVLLVVDDTYESLALLVKILAEAGYQVYPADSGELALAAVRRRLPDLVLLDICMPGIDGLEVCRRLKEDEKTRLIPVIMVSSHADIHDWVSALQLGASDYIYKPVRPEELLLRVRIHLALARASLSLEQQAGELRSANERLLAEIGQRTRAEAALQRAYDELEVRVQDRTAELKRSEERFRTLIEKSPAAVYETDADGHYIYVNTKWCEFAGIGPDEARQEGWQRGLHPEDREKILAQWRKHCLEGNPWNVEYRFCTPEGRVTWVYGTAYALRNERNQVTGYIGTNLDITERRRLEAERARMEVQQQQLQKAESLSRMAGAIAHRYNNLLAGVLGNLELAEDDLRQGANPREDILEAIKCARQAAELSSTMLTYLGQSVVRMEPLDLAEVCRRCLTSLRSHIPTGIQLSADVPAAGIAIRGSASLIQQVLSNLVTNAWEATGSGPGTIRFSAGTIAGSDIPALHRFPQDWCPQEDSYAFLEVADTGCGIPDKEMGILFDPFFSRKFIGRGLGLPVVLGILRMHDGGIVVSSEEGVGSVFRVFLPVSGEVVPEPKEKKSVSGEIPRGISVLLVEDDPAVRRMAGSLLELLGCSVLEARDGQDAVAVLQDSGRRIGCVLCDVTMPRMDGWETLDALRRIAPGIPVILASGYEEDRVMTQARSEKPQAFLAKPYRKEELREAICKALSGTP